MIFLSHTHADKPIVNTVADHLARTFGMENIFYDSWSIQPGDGIIEQINNGLTSCKYFFFFVSKKSLQSNMVKLEWQNALYKSTKEKIKIIPVKIDESMMPEILLQTLYIDIFGHGLQAAIRQMIDTISNQNTYQPQMGFQNIRAYIRKENETLNIEFRAEVYMEPHSRYVILVDNLNDELSFRAIEDGLALTGFHENVSLSNGQTTNAIFLSRSSATSPGFPFIAEISPKNQTPIKLKGVARFVSRERFETLPIIYI